MSAAGPHPTTRLVLAGHRQFMKRDGSGCWAGVRRLAIVTGLDKSTVAKHRALAIAAGWLMVSAQSSRSRYRTYLAAVPNATPTVEPLRAQQPVNFTRLSEQPGQSPQQGLSDFSTSTVRAGRTDSPAPPDRTLVLTNTGTLAQQGTVEAPASTSSPPETAYADGPRSAAELLLRWLQTDGKAESFRSSYKLMINLTPQELRFDGYEEIIRERTTRRLRR
jgi:hypothetical protein